MMMHRHCSGDMLHTFVTTRSVLSFFFLVIHFTQLAHATWWYDLNEFIYEID